MSFIFSNMEFLQRTCLQEVFFPSSSVSCVIHFRVSFSPAVCVDIPGFLQFPQYGKVYPSSQTVLLGQASFLPFLWFTCLDSLIPACFGFTIQKRGVQLKPRPVPLGLCVARMGSVMPLPSGPRPIPGLQPMVCNMRLPMFVSGMGGALSPTTPERRFWVYVFIICTETNVPRTTNSKNYNRCWFVFIWELITHHWSNLIMFTSTATEVVLIRLDAH